MLSPSTSQQFLHKDIDVTCKEAGISVEGRKSFSELENLKKKLKDRTIAYKDSKKETKDALGLLEKFTKNFRESVNEVERLKYKVAKLEVRKKDLKNDVEVAKNKINELKEKIKDKDCALNDSQDISKKAIDEFEKTTNKLEKANNDIDDLENENKRLNAKDEMFRGEIEVRKKNNQVLEKENKALKEKNSSMICQLELSKSEASEGKKKIQKLEEELKEKNKMNQELSDKIQELNDKIKNEYAEQQRLIKPLGEKILASIEEANETEKVKSELSTSKEQLEKLKESIASVTGCSTTSSCEDLMKSMAALKRKLNAPEAHSSTLSAQHQAVKKSESKIEVIVLEDEAN